MQLTFTEMHTPTVGLQIQVDRQLYTEQSDFQRIDVFECEEFGRFLTLDGYMMLTERDEFIYHEMMVHVPLAVLGEKIKKVLVIGGGGAGCSAAIEADKAGAKVMVVTKLRMGDANTMMAEGGIQAADKPNDSPAQHFLDAYGGGR